MISIITINSIQYLLCHDHDFFNFLAHGLLIPLLLFFKAKTHIMVLTTAALGPLFKEHALRLPTTVTVSATSQAVATEYCGYVFEKSYSMCSWRATLKGLEFIMSQVQINCSWKRPYQEYSNFKTSRTHCNPCTQNCRRIDVTVKHDQSMFGECWTAAALLIWCGRYALCDTICAYIQTGFQVLFFNFEGKL